MVIGGVWEGGRNYAGFLVAVVDCSELWSLWWIGVAVVGRHNYVELC